MEFKNILLICLIFLSLNAFAQTNKTPSVISATNTIQTLSLEIGGNYNNHQWGASDRFFYVMNQYTALGFEFDYLDGDFYQSSGNGKLGKTFSTRYGGITTYTITGLGYSFNKLVANNRIIGIGGLGIGYTTPFDFKLFKRYPLRFSTEFEEDTYSNIGKPVLKGFIGLQLGF